MKSKSRSRPENEETAVFHGEGRNISRTEVLMEETEVVEGR